jgi:hypothetical protein
MVLKHALFPTFINQQFMKNQSTRKPTLEVMFFIHWGMHIRVGMIVNIPHIFDDFVLHLIEVPIKHVTYNETSQVSKWVDVMEGEMSSIHKINIWYLMALPLHQVKNPFTTRILGFSKVSN